jgi:quercetin dioxygenase-like cupin family protein
MQFNADLTLRATVHAAQQPWLASPLPGVERRMLHRLGQEVAQATSIVRYAPGSSFSAHTHTGGEEYLVLDGVFEDEQGRYPAGSYVRNPRGTRHTPSAPQGATILVKLWQFDPQDQVQLQVQTADVPPKADPQRPGVQFKRLFASAQEDVRLETWGPHTPVELDLPGGAEFFLLDGSFSEGGEVFAAHSWLRLPCGSQLRAQAGAQGATVWIKQGHLAHWQTPPASA